MRRRPPHLARRRTVLTLALWAVWSGLCAPEARAMTPTEQRALAEAFAPEFVFHPDERFFPCSPLLLTRHDLWPAPPGQPPEAEDGAMLEPIDKRMAEYLALPRAERLRAATVFFRVQPWGRDDGVVVVEYWLYYLANSYAVRKGLLPLHVSDEHAHDLERVFLVVEPVQNAGTSVGSHHGYAVREILASAHTAGVPDNRYAAPPGQIPTPTQVLVELGSHAMATDIDANLSFDPARDARGYRKLVWGIRDSGDLWARYNPRYAAERPPGGSVRLRYSREGDGDPDGVSAASGYRLETVDELQGRLAIDHWSRDDRERLLGHTFWLKHWFGEVDARQLLQPDAHAVGRRPADSWRRLASNESGITLGFTNVNAPFSAVAGVRYAWFTDSLWPDLVLDGSAMIPAGHRVNYETTLFQTYPIDGISRFIVGEALRWDDGWRPRPIWLAGVEWRLNRWRIRGTARNPNSELWIDFRIYSLF